MYSKEHWEYLERMYEELGILKKQMEESIQEYSAKIQELKKEISAERREIAKKLAYKAFADKHPKPKQYSHTLSVELFGKRFCELNEEEKREYSSLSAQRYRERKEEQDNE